MLTYLFAMVPAFLLLVGFAIWARSREGRMLTRSLDRLRPAAGCSARAEVPWLVAPARRAAPAAASRRQLRRHRWRRR